MKKLLFLAFATLGVTNAFSQTFMHGAGAGVYIDKIEHADPRSSFALTYSPRFNFAETKSSSFSVGIPLSIGISGRYNSLDYKGDNATSFMLNAPVILNYNMGAGSTKDNKSRFGGFAGAGFGVHYNSSSSDVVYTDENGIPQPKNTGGNSVGLAANGGVRFAVGNTGKTIEVRLSFFKGLTGNKLSLFGLGAAINF